MTSASELFHSRRRYRSGLSSSLSSSSTLADAISPSYQQRSTIRRQNNRHLEQQHQLEEGEGEGGSSIINNSDRNDTRLPGPVLLARERLVERLRGVSLSGNRQLAETSRSRSRRRNHPLIPLGLNQDDEFKLEAFSSASNSMEECTICLEAFQDGDIIICLLCTHTFHSSCLFPWLRLCGACPNCRKPIPL